MRFGAILLAFLSVGADDDLAACLRTLRAVDKEGAGNEEAAAAWKSLVARGPDALLPTLAAFDGAPPRAVNWLRAAVDAIADGKQPLDAKKLDEFVRDTKRDGQARRLAYDLLVRLDPTCPDRLL